MGFHNNTASGVESYKKMLLNDILDATEYLTEGNTFDRDCVRLSDDGCGFMHTNIENQIKGKHICWNYDVIKELQSKTGLYSLGSKRVESTSTVQGLSQGLLHGVTLNPLYISYYIDNLKNK